jgi:hypothetical protein
MSYIGLGVAAKAIVAPLASWTNVLGLVIGHASQIGLVVGAFVVLVVWILWGQADTPGRTQVLAVIGGRRWSEIAALLLASIVALWVYRAPVHIDQAPEPLSICKLADLPALMFDRWDEARSGEGIGALYQPTGEQCQQNPPRGCDPPACAFGDLPGHTDGYLVVSVYGGWMWPANFSLTINAGDSDILADVAYSSFLVKTGPNGHDRSKMEFHLKGAGRFTSAVVYFTRASRVDNDPKAGRVLRPLANTSFATWSINDVCRGRVALEGGYADVCS